MIKKKRLLCLAPAMLLALTLASCGEQSSQSGSSSGQGGSSSGDISSTSGGSSSSETDIIDTTSWDGKVKIYYHDDAGDYANTRIWAWGVGVDGKEYQFDNVATASSDDFGGYTIFDMSAAPWAGNVTNYISFIIKTAGTWSGQSTDTVCYFSKYVDYAVDDMITIYSCKGNGGVIDTYTKSADALGDRLATAAFSSWTKIAVTGTGDGKNRDAAEVGKVESADLYGFDNSYYRLSSDQQTANKSQYLIKTVTPGSNSFSIDLDSAADPTISYTIEAKMSQDTSKVKSKIASFTALFTDSTFINNYVYSGDDLGCTPTSTQVTFKLWAPTSSRVQVRIFFSGTPSDISGTEADDWHYTYDMEKGLQGVWQLSVEGEWLDNTLPYFYTYVVTNSQGINEVCDPYAKSTGLNGRRAAILDYSTLENPDGWDKIDSYSTNDSLLPTISSPNQLSVYEVHIRDLTADKTWVSNKGNLNGTYNAFSEAGTTYSKDGTSVKTGRDNISEMKFDAVQLLPVFDQDNDERWSTADGAYTTPENPGDAKVAPSYNWGYNPLNYNVVEGAYSSNPFSSTVKIYEYKNLIKSYAEDGTRVIMDVVYNHVASVNSSNLTKIVPYYYFRTNSDGYYTNGSGVGNETATERAMMRKLIVDSCVWWASYYKIKGFRFDVMGVMDCATLKAVSKALYAVDPNIVLYGEGWTADGSYGMSDKTGTRAVMASCYTTLYSGQDDCPIGIGCFNSVGKQALKGEEHLGWGFMNRGSDWFSDDAVSRVTYMLNGHVNNGNDLDYANPTQTVNYASCHDNYTNYDQMNYTVGTGPSSGADSTVAMEASVAGMSAVLFSEGIAFTQGGEEIFRQKLMEKDNPYYDTITSDDYVTLGNGTKLVRNSYMYGDEVNSFKWDRKVTYNKYFESFKNACLARAKVKGTILGRAYDSTSQWGAQGVTGWGDAIEHGVGIAYQIGSTSSYYYGFLIGRLNSDGYNSKSGTTQVGMGAGSYEIIYSSYGRTGSISVGTDYKFTAYQNEFLLIKN